MASLRHTCAIITLSNQHLGVQVIAFNIKCPIKLQPTSITISLLLSIFFENIILFYIMLYYIIFGTLLFFYVYTLSMLKKCASSSQEVYCTCFILYRKHFFSR